MNNKIKLWNKIEDWFDNLHIDDWKHCYATLDENGNLVHVQSSGRDYCEGAHYMISGHYSFSGKTKLSWKFAESKGTRAYRGMLTFPNGRETHRWSSYLAVILFKTKSVFNNEKGRFQKIWDGETLPTLLFHRERANRNIKHPFTSSKYVSVNEVDKISVPDDFVKLAKLYYDLLIEFIKETKNSS